MKMRDVERRKEIKKRKLKRGGTSDGYNARLQEKKKEERIERTEGRGEKEM